MPKQSPKRERGARPAAGPWGPRPSGAIPSPMTAQPPETPNTLFAPWRLEYLEALGDQEKLAG